MTYIVLAVGVALFVTGLKFTRLAATVSRVVADVSSTTAVLRSASTSEAQKEASARAAAGRMFRSLFVIVGSLLVALAFPIALLLVASRLGLCTIDEVLQTAASWQAVVGATFLTVVILLAWR